MGHLIDRRKATKTRIAQLRDQLDSAEKILGAKACVYATGSFGRLEAGDKSDLDLFIVGKTLEVPGYAGVMPSQLSRLDEILVKADLIAAIRRLGLPDFDGDGKYLNHYSVDEFTKTLGKPEDDANNTLTGRLLLFLESQPLLGSDNYTAIINEVIAAYWRDYGDHKESFMPAFLANDILRLWRTFCVNYEARTERDPLEEKIKGKIKNYKLKHSRMLTCYSALLYLLGIFIVKGTVSPADATEMTLRTPTERLEWLMEEAKLKAVRDPAQRLLEKYEDFLQKTNIPEEELISIFKDKEDSKVWMDGSYEFGDLMFKALAALGQDNKFFRLIVV